MKKLFFLLLTLSCPLSLVGRSFGAEVSFSEYPGLLTNVYSTPLLEDKRAIVEYYCAGAFSPSLNQADLTETGNQFSFSPKNALFVRALCGAWMSGAVDTSLTEGVFQKDFIKKLNLTQWDGREDVCATSSRDQCDVTRYTSRIFMTLMSDIFKIKWAHFFQVYTVNDLGTKAERVARIFDTYFAMVQDPSYFQSKFPKTAAMMDSNQRVFLKSLQSVVLLDNTALYEKGMDCTSQSPIPSFVCALHMPGNRGATPHFVHLIMHEYLNYRVFVDFYAYQMQQRREQLSDADKNIAFAIELESLAKQRDALEQAIQTSLTDFQDVVATYPLHLGLVLYQEELLRFRDKYASKLVTPFYTLYEKLRNVQPLTS